MSTPQAAEHFGVNIKTIRRWISNGKLFAEMVDGRWHVHIEGRDVSHKSLNGTDNGKHLAAQLKRADSEIQHLRDQLTEKDNQLIRRDEQTNHLQQLLAVSQKSIQQLTEQNQLLLEDQRQRSWWQRIFRRG